jgi:5'-3' exonuclease
VLAIIDGDVLCYDACRPRHLTKLQDGVNVIKLDAEGKKIPQEFTDAEDLKYLDDSWEVLKKDLSELKSKLFCKTHLMAVQGDKDFRYTLFPEYKANRAKREPEYARRIRIVPSLRERAVESGMAIYAEYREADDYVRTWALEARRAGDPYVVCTIDKDLKCIPGKYYNTKKRVLEEISEEEARRHYYMQILKGDSTDGIPGIPGVGDVTAQKLTAMAVEDSEFRQILIEQYMVAYGDDWYHYLLINAKLIHIQRHLNDWFSLSSWPEIQELREYNLL